MNTGTPCGRVRTAEYESFEIAEFVLGSELSVPEHAHDRPALAVGLDGRCELIGAGHTIARLARGDLLTIPGDFTHREKVLNGTSRCLLIFSKQPDTVVGHELRRQTSRTIAELGAMLADAVREQDSLGADATAHELFATARFGVADEAARSGSPGWLAIVAEHLEDCYRSPPSLTELSRQAGVSPEHVARVFRRETGLTVGQFVRLRRVLEGSRRLREGSTNLSEVAMSCGYADQSHFTRELRRFLGTTPHVHRLLFRSREL